MRALLSRINHIRFSPDASVWSRTATMAFMMGMLFGVFDVLIVGGAVFGGRYQSCSRSGNDICDFYLLAVTYPIGAAAMGAIIGAGYPLFRRLWSAVLVTTAAMVPWFALIAISNVKTRAHWAADDSWLVGACSVLMGVGMGYVIWKRRPGLRPR